jgi:acyl dehydratase
MKYLDDIRVGEKFPLGCYTFSAEKIKAFAACHDPQPFHLDEAAAARSHFGRLCASGWHTAAVWMRLLLDFGRREDDAREVLGEPSASLGPSPGFRDLKWLKPVYAGDTITYASEVVASRVSESRPGWGLLTVRNTGTNQHGDIVISFVSTTYLECRPAPGASR